MTTEKEVIAEAMLHYNTGESRIWRNTRGVDIKNERCPRCGYRSGPMRVMRYGIPASNGGSDLIGIAKGGKFVAIECKSSKGKATKEQMDFLKLIARLGGVSIIYTPEGAYIINEQS